MIHPASTLILGLDHLGIEVVDQYRNRIENLYPNSPWPQPLQTLSIHLGAIDPAYHQDVDNGDHHFSLASTESGRERDILGRLYPNDQFGNSESLSAHQRVLGAVRLHEHYAALIEKFQQISRLSTENLILEQDGPVGNQEVHAFVVAPLASSLVTGLLTELIYLLNYAAKREVNILRTHLILIWPSEETHSMRQSSLANERKEGALACIEELRYFCGNRHHYKHHFGNDFVIDSANDPLNGGALYLLDMINENGSKIDEIGLVEMVAGVLVQASDQYDRTKLFKLREGADTPINSFGYSQIYLERGKIFDQVARAASLQYLDEVIGTQEAINFDDLNGEVEQFQINLSTISERLRRLPAVEHFPNLLNELRVNNPDPIIAQTQIQATFDELIKQGKPQLVQTLRATLQEEVNRFRQDLRTRSAMLIDKNRWGLSATIDYFIQFSRSFDEGERPVRSLRTELRPLQQKLRRMVGTGSISTPWRGIPFGQFWILIAIALLPLFILTTYIWNETGATLWPLLFLSIAPDCSIPFNRSC